MSEFMITEGSQPPLSALILSSWEDGLYRARTARTSKEFKPFFEQATSYFQLRFNEFGIKRLGVIETALNDPVFRELNTSPVVINGKKRAPYLRPEDVDPRVLLNLAIQLSGSPLEKITLEDGKQVDGPGAGIPHLPTIELQEEWGTNIGLLQSMNILFNAGGKVKDHKWAQGQNMTVNSAMSRFAIAYGIENELRAWSDPNHALIQERLSDLEAGILSYNRALRLLAANNNSPPEPPSKKMAGLAKDKAKPKELVASTEPSPKTSAKSGRKASYPRPSK